MRLISKSREGGRLRRFHDRPRTPYERLLESPRVTEEGKAQLRREYASLDPFELREQCEKKLRAIFRQVRRSRKGDAKARRAA